MSVQSDALNKELTMQVETLESALERETKAREYLETVLEEKTRSLFLSNQYYTSLFDSMKNGVIVATKDGSVEKVNDSMLKLLELEDAFLISSHINDFFRLPNFKGREDVSIEDFEEDKDYELVLKNSKETPVNCTVSSIKNSQSAEDQFVFVVTDVTMAKEASKEKAILQDQLIKKAYTDGLAENAIGVLHNIGNVLTAIIGKTSNFDGLETLEKISGILEKINTTENVSTEIFEKAMYLIKDEIDDVNETIQQDYKFIQEKSNHIAEVIAAQQRYANLKSDIKSTLNIGSMIHDCLLLHEERMLKRKIKVKQAGDYKLDVFIEKNGLAQTLSNLIVNASESIEERVQKDEYFEHGEGEVCIEVSDLGNKISLKVIDNGMGISEENLKKLFDFGFSTKERDSGFGLHNCANFMKKQNGAVKLFSEGEFKGACSELVIPKPEVD